MKNPANIQRTLLWALLVYLGVSFLTATLVRGTTYTWNNSNASWTNTADWSPSGTVPGLGDTVATTTPNGTRTITLDGNQTISSFAFVVNNNRTFVISPGTPTTSTLTLDNNGSPFVLSISAGVTAGNVTFNIPLLGTDGLTKTGVGHLNLTAANLYTGNTTVSAGYFYLQGASASLTSTGLIVQGTSTVTIDNNTALPAADVVSFANGTTFNLNWSGNLNISALTLGGTPVSYGNYTAANLSGLDASITFAGSGILSVQPTAVPEPAAWAAVVAAGAVLVVWRRKQPFGR